MLHFAQEPQRRIGIAPLGQPLVCETRRRQYESSYGHALDHGPFRFCATSRNGMLCKFARLARPVLSCPTPARSRRVGTQPPPSPAVVDAPPVSTFGSTDSVTVPSPGVPSLLPVYPRLHLLSRALTCDNQPTQDGASGWRRTGESTGPGLDAGSTAA